MSDPTTVVVEITPEPATVVLEVPGEPGPAGLYPGGDWSIANVPYVANSVVNYDDRLWLALRDNSVSPSEGDDWAEWADFSDAEADRQAAAASAAAALDSETAAAASASAASTSATNAANSEADAASSALLAAAALTAAMTVVTDATTARTLAASDMGKVIRFTNGSAITVTLPADAVEGFHCVVIQAGAGQITFTPEAGAISNNAFGYTKSYGQGAMVGMLVEANSGGSAATYVLEGAMAA